MSTEPNYDYAATPPAPHPLTWKRRAAQIKGMEKYLWLDGPALQERAPLHEGGKASAVIFGELVRRKDSRKREITITMWCREVVLEDATRVFRFIQLRAKKYHPKKAKL